MTTNKRDSISGRDSISKKAPDVLYKTLLISYDNLEDSLVAFLYAIKAIPESWDVITTDLGVPLNDEGLVEVKMVIVKPSSTTEEQLELPIEVFDMVNLTTIKN